MMMVIPEPDPKLSQDRVARQRQYQNPIPNWAGVESLDNRSWQARGIMGPWDKWLHDEIMLL